MHLMGKSFWSLADVITAMKDGGDSDSTPQEQNPRLALGWGSSSSAKTKETELDDLSKKSKGYLIEQIYKKTWMGKDVWERRCQRIH